ncbi:MAG TPA: aspartyl protease family protein [Fimbriimonadaceae bacterium]|nr:aspartyl protease family protein [Fimbriimonadaceae bacterium]
MFPILPILATVAPAPSHKIPFHYLHEGMPLIMVPVAIEGQGPFECIVDTGNSKAALLLSESLASQLGLDQTKFKASRGFTVDIEQRLRLGRIGRFEVAGIRVKDPEVAIAPALDQLTQRMGGLRIDGNLGYPFFKDYTLSLDYIHKTIEFSQEPATAQTIPITVSSSKPLIVVRVVANGKKLSFVLDTGASMTCISKPAAAELGLIKGADVPLNLGPGEKGYLSSLESLRVGSAEQHDVRVVAAPFLEALGKEMRRKIDGVLGFNFWSKYRLVIDYPNQRLGFEAPK